MISKRTTISIIWTYWARPPTLSFPLVQFAMRDVQLSSMYSWAITSASPTRMLLLCSRREDGRFQTLYWLDSRLTYRSLDPQRSSHSFRTYGGSIKLNQSRSRRTTVQDMGPTECDRILNYRLMGKLLNAIWSWWQSYADDPRIVAGTSKPCSLNRNYVVSMPRVNRRKPDLSVTEQAEL